MTGSVGQIARRVSTPTKAAQQVADTATVAGAGQWALAWRSLRENRWAFAGVVVLCAIVVACIAGPALDPWSATAPPAGHNIASSPSLTHPLGTDSLGRDELARLLAAGRISLLIGLMVALISSTIGAAVGIAAGYFGGLVDEALMWLVDVLMTLPPLVLLAALGAVVASGSGPAAQALSGVPPQWRIIAIMSLLGWMGISRIVRSQVITLRTREFVEAARALGSSDRRILVQHILPNTVGVLAVFTTLAVSGAILGESSLSFLGFGVNPPTASWGNMLLDARDAFTAIEYWWETWFPALAILITVLAINFVGDGLRDALDPGSKKQ